MHNKEILLGVELTIKPQGLVVNLLGKNPKYKSKPPYASSLYNEILKDNPNSIRILSDRELSDEGLNLWKKMIELGHKVSLYDRDNPGKTFKSFNSGDELDQYFKNDDTDFKRYQYVLSENAHFIETLANFNTRRARELCGFSLDD
jgi:hypothetical protein